MTIRNFLITTLSAGLSLTAFPHLALGQDAPQCTIDQISEALNQLNCTVSGAFVSSTSLVKTITSACEPTADEETCHACFRKSGGKVGPALKALAKAKILPKSSLSEFRIALVTAEETTCAAKAQPEDNQDQSDDSYNSSEPSSPGTEAPQDRGRGRGRGQDDSPTSEPSDRPERASRPERPDRQRGF